MNLKEKINEYKAIIAELAPKMAELRSLMNTVEEDNSTDVGYVECNILCDKIEELQAKGNDVAIDIAFILTHSIIEEVPQGQPYKVEIGSDSLNENYTLISKSGTATIIISDLEVKI
jgi:translation initiation factor 2B subunit (eIF-2B alpha/beta/delta family)